MRGRRGLLEKGSSRTRASLGEGVESDNDKDDKKRDGQEGTWEPIGNGENDLGDLWIREEEESMRKGWEDKGWERLRITMENKGVGLTGWYQFWTLFGVNLDKFWSNKE